MSLFPASHVSFLPGGAAMQLNYKSWILTWIRTKLTWIRPKMCNDFCCTIQRTAHFISDKCKSDLHKHRIYSRPTNKLTIQPGPGWPRASLARAVRGSLPGFCLQWRLRRSSRLSLLGLTTASELFVRITSNCTKYICSTCCCI